MVLVISSLKENGPHKSNRGIEVMLENAKATLTANLHVALADSDSYHNYRHSGRQSQAFFSLSLSQ